MLTLDAQRAAAHRLDPLPCIAARNMCMPGVLPFSGALTKVKAKATNSLEANRLGNPRLGTFLFPSPSWSTQKQRFSLQSRGEKDQSAVEDRLGSALGAMIRVITSHPAGIILTLVIFLALAGVSAWQVSLGLGLGFQLGAVLSCAFSLALGSRLQLGLSSCPVRNRF